MNTVCVPSGYGDKTLSVKLFFLLVKYLCADVQATRCDESIFLSAKSCVYEIMLWLLSCQSIQRLKDELIFLIFRWLHALIIPLSKTSNIIFDLFKTGKQRIFILHISKFIVLTWYHSG